MFTEDVDQFFSDFAFDATFNGITGRVLLDVPENIVADGNVISGDFQMTYKTGTFPGLAYHSSIDIEGTAYTVNEVYAAQDGAVTIATLSKT